MSQSTPAAEETQPKPFEKVAGYMSPSGDGRVLTRAQALVEKRRIDIVEFVKQLNPTGVMKPQSVADFIAQNGDAILDILKNAAKALD